MPHDPARVADVKAWLAKATVDLRAAKHDRTAKPPITEDIVFHAQQLVEKSLKAFLCWHDVPFRKTHNLIEVGELCATIDGTLEPLLKNAAGLTEYAWKYRYPGEMEVPPVSEADEAIHIADNVYKAVLGRLPKETHP